MMTKACTKCGQIKLRTDFHKRGKSTDGLSYWCKECAKVSHREHYKINSDKIKMATKTYYLAHHENQKLTRRKWMDDNREKHLNNMRTWYVKNHVLQRQKQKDYNQLTKPQRNAYLRRYMADPAKRLRHNICTNMAQAIHNKKSGRSWEKLVGYSLADLICHLEKQFSNGMSWDSYGRSSGAENWWSVDHIRSIKSFGFPDIGSEAFSECWSLINLRPLWHVDNCRKQHRDIGV